MPGQEPREAGPCLDPHQTRGAALGIGHHRALDQRAGHREGHAGVAGIEPGLEGLPRLAALQDALRPLPHGQALRRERHVAAIADEGGQTLDLRGHRLLHGGVREAERVGGHEQRVGQTVRHDLAEQDLADPREGRRVPGEPAAGVRTRRLDADPGKVDAAVRRPDAVEPAEARRHAHGAAGIGAQGEVAGARSHRGGRAAGRAAGHPVRRRRIERRAVVGVLAEDSQRDLVGHRLADGRGARIEQRLHHAGMAGRRRVDPRPVRVAARRGAVRDVDQILDGEGEAGERPRRGSGDADARPGQERVRREGLRGRHAGIGSCHWAPGTAANSAFV